MPNTHYSRRHFIAASSALGLGMAILTPRHVAAQNATGYPDGVVRIVVPYPAGGATDTLARMFAEKLQQSWNQAIIVENKPGASGTIGNDYVARAKPDGLTILMGITAIVQVPPLMPNLTYDVHTDLRPLVQVANANSVLVVPRSSPIQTVEAFLAHVKANPGKLNYGSYGIGTSSHIQGELLNLQAGLDLVHVPYRGAAPLIQDLRGNQLFCALVDISTLTPHLEAVNTLAVTGPSRNEALPDVPSFTELGYQDFEPLGWFGLFMPAGVPDAIAQKFAEEGQRILAMPDVIERIKALGLRPGTINAEEFAQTVKQDADIYARIIREANIRLK